ncbi:putative membrane protein [Anseongella ginsenosidimutans]|uniref:Putative membrane protein n=1 Tax=Anseongella ginsenosidimutans TaxID=496056 RepID=A0A4R3KU46_9SPHI|nr:c-type cytochrome domain-containing protein [Anseongella ginsenosidimutans]QEC52932.1 hypothetical protein FRZ59_11685 [Anseongella ginsenosidimutans]TCS87325.1 putative membrane protein [Anseongella ginsenosidimutans]
MEEIISFIGSWHPLLVHLPIGMLIMAFLLEWVARKEKYAAFRPAVPAILLAGSIAAILSCVAGYFLSLGGGYNETTLAWHKWLGILVAAAATFAWLLKRFPTLLPRMNTLHFPLLVFLMLLLTAAGHYGGSLTHGSDYLSKNLPGPVRGIFGLSSLQAAELPVIPDVQEAAVFNEVVLPVLSQRCVSCHNEDKMKGELRLDSREMILKGGEGGPILSPGRPAESELISRLLLPEDHDDHMPPKGKTPLTEEQISLLHWWIASGAPFDKKVKEISQPDSIKPLLLALESGAAGKAHAFLPEGEAPEPAPASSLEALRARGIKVLPVAQESTYLQVSCINDTTFGDAETALLLPLKEQLVWLDLGNTEIGNEGLKNLASLENLTRLHLAHTNVGDQGLSFLAASKNLGFLNLYDTQVTDQGLQHLKNLTALQEVHLYQTGVSAAGLQQLRDNRPELRVDTGNYRLPLLAADTVQF